MSQAKRLFSYTIEELDTDEQDIEIVTASHITIRINEIDTAIITCRAPATGAKRPQIAEGLIGNRIKITHDPEGSPTVVYIGYVARIKYDRQNKRLLYLHCEDPTRILKSLIIGEGDSDSADVGVGFYDPNDIGPQKITVVDAANKRLYSPYTPVQPAGYEAGDHSAYITPSSQYEGNLQTITSIEVPAECEYTGVVGDLTDIDYATKVYLKVSISETLNPTTIVFEGTSGVAKANVTQMDVHAFCMQFVELSYNVYLKLMLYNYVTTQWDWVNTIIYRGAEFRGQIREIYSKRITNDYVAPATNKFRIKLESLTGNPSGWFAGVHAPTGVLKVHELVVKVYGSDANYNPASGDYIVSYTEDEYVTMLLDPTAYGIAVGDTMTFSKDSETLFMECVNSFSATQRQEMTIQVTGTFAGATSANFRGKSLLELFKWAQDRDNFHWYFDHATNNLHVVQQAYLEEHNGREITESDIRDYEPEHRLRSKESRAGNIFSEGATFRRHDGLDLVISSLFPKDWHDEIDGRHLLANETAKIRHEDIYSFTETLLYSYAYYLRLQHEPHDLVLLMKDFDVTKDLVGVLTPSNGADITLEGKTWTRWDEDADYGLPRTQLDLIYTVGGHIRAFCSYGWGGTKSDQVTGKKIDQLQRDVSILRHYVRERFAKLPVSETFFPTLHANSIQAIGRPNHKLDLNAGADLVELYPGDLAANNFWQFLSTDATALSPVMRPNADLEGYVGTLSARLRYLCAQTWAGVEWHHHSDTDRKVDISQVDIFDFKPGADAADNFFRMESQSDAESWPTFRPNVDEEGRVGTPSFQLNQINTKYAYVQTCKRKSWNDWYWLDPRMGGTMLVGAQNNRAPGYFQIGQVYVPTFPAATYYYAAGYIAVPVGYKAKIVAIKGFAYQSTNLRWAEMLLRVIDFDMGTHTRTITSIRTISNPFSTNTGDRSYYDDTSFTERWFYGYDDDSTQTLSEIQVRYRTYKGSTPGNWLYLYGHAVKVYYELI